MKCKALVFDIETAYMQVKVWDLGKQYIGHSQIVKDWHVMSWAAKWLDDSPNKMMYQDQRHAKDVTDDKKILLVLRDLLNQADIVITQNGKKFDSRKITARMIEHGIVPPSPYKHIDTYKEADKIAAFSSHSLDYMTEKLNVKYKKLKHKKFPGMSLWDECIAGNREAWDEMKKYNIHDVLATEELYGKIKAWIPDSAPKIYDVTDKSYTCGTCGVEGHMIEGKERRAKTYKYKQHQCQLCGSWQAGVLVKGAA